MYLYEVGGIAANSGASVRLLRGDRGRFTAEQMCDLKSTPEAMCTQRGRDSSWSRTR